MALASLPAAALFTTVDALQAADAPAKPNSKVRSVQIGLNVPYSFNSPAMSGDDILKNCLRLGLSAVELRSQPVEAFLGFPARPAGDLKQARLSASMDKAGEFRKKYEEAGVLIQIVKFDGIYGMDDAVIDYCFTLAKTLGARAISCELELPKTERLGKFADKHKMRVGYHGHDAVTPEIWEKAFSYAEYNGANVDLGHFVAGNNTSPVPFIKKYHDKITHVHVKDRKMHKGPNTPLGQGDTPIKEVLQLIRDNHWEIQATIEFEYPVPPGSDRMAEIGKCIQYCREALA